MPKWELFEENCTDYLNQNFGEYAKFVHQGCSDSTKSDILVTRGNDELFYIDAKLSPAQCGQFVLIPDMQKRVFEYSPRNVNRVNCYAEEIIRFMNSDFELYTNAGTRGENIIFDSSDKVFADWVIKIYKDKNVKFFITNNYTILPVEKFGEFFNVTAKFRIKRSGSCSVNRYRLEDVKKCILNMYKGININTSDGKLYAETETDIDKQRFVVGDYEYMFGLRGDGRYEVRQLSNTFNSNVIFSIELKHNVSGLSDEEFIKCLGLTLN